MSCQVSPEFDLCVLIPIPADRGRLTDLFNNQHFVNDFVKYSTQL
jgi:hypothetical protein